VKQLRVGLLGYGDAGRHHARALQACDGVAWTALGTRDPSRAPEVPAGVAIVTVDDLFAGGHCDAIVIATPDGSHAEHADAPIHRTWLRLSFEERRRIFDRRGNAHNPLFDYAWEMVERDIEQLHLVPFRADGDPSHNVFPWQALDGSLLPPDAPKTKPRLRR
jgi:hypothetical protein